MPNQPPGDSWMQTVSGGVFSPFAPEPNSIKIEDIAHALSNICRYNGHTRVFYSVAQHSVLVSQHCPHEHRLSGLLHDGAEAYLADIVRPVKPYLPDYRHLEARLEKAISERFGVPHPMPAIVKEIDTRILHDERNQLMTKPPRDWNIPGEPLGIEIDPWAPDRARQTFLREFCALYY